MKMKKAAGFALTMSLAISSLGMSVYAASNDSTAVVKSAENNGYISVKEMGFETSTVSIAKILKTTDNVTEIKRVDIRDDECDTVLTIEPEEMYIDEETGEIMVSKGYFEAYIRPIINENKVPAPYKSIISLTPYDSDRD